MKNMMTRWLAIFAVVATGCMVAGCNEAAKPAADMGTTEATMAASTQATGGCCGQCASVTATATDQSAGCCGQCINEAATQEAAGCCGKCSGELAAKPAVETGESCQGDCNACAEGDAAACRCGDAVAGAAGRIAAGVNTMRQDRDVFHFLLANHDKITRTVTQLENGVSTVTESSDPQIAAKIQEHVASMYQRVEDGRPLRMWDDLYREIFRHADKIDMQITKTERGISVTETSDDEYVVKLIQTHAQVVTGFANRGFEEARLNHEPPRAPASGE
jgi:hypothetical protein